MKKEEKAAFGSQQTITSTYEQTRINRLQQTYSETKAKFKYWAKKFTNKQKEQFLANKPF